MKTVKIPGFFSITIAKQSYVSSLFSTRIKEAIKRLSKQDFFFLEVSPTCNFTGKEVRE